MTEHIYFEGKTKIVQNEYGKFYYKEQTRQPGQRRERSKNKWTFIRSELLVKPRTTHKSTETTQDKDQGIFDVQVLLALKTHQRVFKAV